MSKLFEPRSIKADGIFSKYGSVRLFTDIGGLKITDGASENIIKKAEEILEKEIKVLPLSLFREYFLIGKRTYSGPMAERRNNLLVLFLAEYQERKGRFTEKMVDYIWAIMEESTWMQNPSYPNNSPYGRESTVPAVFGPDRLHGIELVAPSCGAVLAIVNYYMKDELDRISPVISEKIVYTVKDRLIKPFIYCDFWWKSPHREKLNNWAPWITSNILLVTALVEENEYVRNRIFNECLSVIDHFVDGYDADGGCDEGPAYWGHAAASLFDCLEILYDLTDGKINVFDDPMVKAMGEYLYKVNISGKRYVNFADSPPEPMHSGRLVYRYGERCGSEYLCSLGRSLLSYERPGSVAFSHTYRSIKNLSMTVEPCECAKAPTHIWMPGLCVMISRESENTNEGLHLAIKGGSNNESHNHNDVGSFTVHYCGKPVLIDAGSGEYTKKVFSAERYDVWQTQSHYHNLPAFDGVGQHNGGAYRATDIEYNEEKKSLKMQLKDAYERYAGIISYIREAKLKEDEITVIDEVELEGEKEVDLRYLTPSEPKLLEGNEILLAEDRIMSYSEGLVAEIEKFVPDKMTTWGEFLWRIHLKKKTNKDTFVIKIK